MYAALAALHCELERKHTASQSLDGASAGASPLPFAGGGLQNGLYVHAMEAEALNEILGELDTAPDFLEYLLAKEAFSGSVVCEGEENLFAAYLHEGRATLVMMPFPN
jgi:hypothetical protein